MLSEIDYLYEDIQKEYGNEGNLGVEFTVNPGIGKSIKIEWENSDYFDPSDPEIEDKSIELAQFVRNHYADIDKVDNVWIVFTNRQGSIVNISQSVSFVYELDELEDLEAKTPRRIF